MCLADHPAHEVVLMLEMFHHGSNTYWPITVFQKMIRTGSSFCGNIWRNPKGMRCLAVNMQGIMCLMMVVVLVMTMVYMPHYVCWNT